jgi:hypothetical protein
MLSKVEVSAMGGPTIANPGKVQGVSDIMMYCYVVNDNVVG